MIDIPLYQLEHARRNLERLFAGECCMYDIDETHWHDPDFEDDRDRRVVVDLLDEVIETKRREIEAHRVNVATGGRL